MPSSQSTILQAAERLRNLSFGPELSPGARNAVRVCLRIQPTEKVTIITDNLTREIAASLAREVEAVRAPRNVFVLDDLAHRPLAPLPAELPEHLESRPL